MDKNDSINPNSIRTIVFRKGGDAGQYEKVHNLFRTYYFEK